MDTFDYKKYLAENKLNLEELNTKYKPFVDQVYKHVNALDGLLGANKPPAIPVENWGKIYGAVGDVANEADFLMLIKSDEINEANIGLADIKQMGNKEGFAALGKTIPKFNFQNVPDTEAFVEGFVEGVSQYGSKFMKAKFDDSMFEALNMSNLPEVERIVNILKQADLDGETLQYILEKIGMDEQMWKQLNVTYGNPMELEEALNPEVQRTVNNLIRAMAKKYGYEEKDAVFAIQAALKQREFEDKKPFNK